MIESSRRPRTLVLGGLAATVLLLGGGTARAQDDHDRDRDGGKRDVQLGLGVGLVDPEDSEEAEIYATASLRIRVGQKADQGGGDGDGDGDWEGDHYRGHPPAGRDSGILGYIEPEVGYWSGGGDAEDIEDLLVGVNLVGVVPTRNADYYLGVGFGLHFFDATLRREVGGIDAVIQQDDELLGGNVHVGVDVNLGPNLALFGTGRFDILEGDIAERQTKVYGGLRLKF